MAGAVCVVSLTLLLEACARSPIHEPVTLTLLEEWSTKIFNEAREQELQQFTRETGIRVKLLPSPESAREKLELWQDLLRIGASGPDVYGIDVIWTRILNEYFLDLRPYFGNESPLQFPAITASYSVDNKLVAIAYRADIGLLFYRTDLLRGYGYQTISVNNPDAIRAWRRAARWVGSISPPGVGGYVEADALNVWIAGAAFMRNWPTAFVDSQAAGSPIRNRFDITILPAGKGGLFRNSTTCLMYLDQIPVLPCCVRHSGPA
jgi:ABC-type glycerol-3-phosphate transport system substrate-binding protein